MTDYLKKAEKALDYLAESEAEWAALKASHQANDKRRKIVRAGCLLIAEGKTVPEREAVAETHPDYKEAVDRWETSMEDFFLIDAKRTRANLTIEMFRSVNSSMKRGNI